MVDCSGFCCLLLDLTSCRVLRLRVCRGRCMLLLLYVAGWCWLQWMAVCCCYWLLLPATVCCCTSVRGVVVFVVCCVPGSQCGCPFLAVPGGAREMRHCSHTTPNMQTKHRTSDFEIRSKIRQQLRRQMPRGIRDPPAEMRSVIRLRII